MSTSPDSPTLAALNFSPALSPTQGAAQATDLFRQVFGTDPDGVWQAPGRVNIIGEHTDYNGGLALPIALPHRAFLALRRRPDRSVRLVSARDPQAVEELDLDVIGPKGSPGEVTQWAAYIAGVAWSLERAGHTGLPGFDAALVSCVPLGGGLSSSAALECATAVALDAVADLGLAGGDEPDDAGRAQLVEVCVRTENEMVGAPTGGMDQSASLRCRPGHALELDCRDGSVTHVPFDLDAEGLALLVIDTRAAHSLSDGQYGQRRDACEESARILGVELLADIDPADLDAALARLRQAGPATRAEVLIKRTRHVVTEIARTRELVSLLQAGEALSGEKLRAVGALMDASHESLRVDYECTCPELDVAVEAARAAGAYGARMTGGGFGGSAIALVRRDAVVQVASAVVAAYKQAGFTPPALLDAVPSAPAGRVQ